jgi:hypothetical protein
MTKVQSALDAVDAALAAIEGEISAHAAGRGGVGDRRQLTGFRTDLEAMKHQLAAGTLPPRAQRITGVGRTIADSWPFDSPLGAVLLEAEQKYLRA